MRLTWWSGIVYLIGWQVPELRESWATIADSAPQAMMNRSPFMEDSYMEL
jgi:hypothetical protein